MTSSNGNILHVTGLLCREFIGHRWIPRTQRPVTWSFDVFYLGLNQQLSKQWRCRWFEMPSRPLWRHCNSLTSWCLTIFLLKSVHLRAVMSLHNEYNSAYNISYPSIILTCYKEIIIVTSQKRILYDGNLSMMNQYNWLWFWLQHEFLITLYLIEVNS